MKVTQGGGLLPSEFLRIFEKIQYKPGWELYISTYIALDDYSFAPTGANEEPRKIVVQASAPVQDVVTRRDIRLYGPHVDIYLGHREGKDFKWVPLAKERIEKFIVDMTWEAIRILEEHEMKEQFNYNGIRIYDPHRNKHLEKLWELAESADLLPRDMLRKRFEEVPMEKE